MNELRAARWMGAFALAVFLTAAAAQDIPSALGLDAAAPGLIRNENDLMVTRGVQPTRLDPLQGILSVEVSIRERLLEGEGLLVYQQRPDRLDGWLIPQRGPTVAFSHAVSAPALHAMVGEWRSALTRGFGQVARAPALRGAVVRGAAGLPAISSEEGAKRVASALLPPGGLPTGLRHLTIVPAGGTALVPWPALPIGPDRQLVDQVSISLAPSLGQFLALPERSWQPVTDIRSEAGPHKRYTLVRANAIEYTVTSAIVVGDPDYAPDDTWNFPPLPGARREAKAVAGRINESVLAGPSASKAAVLDALRARRVDMIYLATHAVASETNPLDASFLALAGMPGRPPQEARWTARDIQQQRILADLVVLSACQTGMGQVHDAGVIGVGRAFYLAGVPNVLVSLWSVDDEATADLMDSFARHLTQPREYRYFPADALREAMLKAREKRANPVFWASFASFGFPNVMWVEEEQEQAPAVRR